MWQLAALDVPPTLLLTLHEVPLIVRAASGGVSRAELAQRPAELGERDYEELKLSSQAAVLLPAAGCCSHSPSKQAQVGIRCHTEDTHRTAEAVVCSTSDS